MTTAWRAVTDPSGTPRPQTLAAIAEYLGGELVGEGRLEIVGVSALDQATPEHLSFAHSASWLGRAADSRAGALLIPPSLRQKAEEEVPGLPLILAEGGTLAVSRVQEMFHQVPRPTPGVHPTAVVADGCELGEDVHVGAYAVLGEGTHVGARTVIEPHTVVGRHCRVGADGWLHANVVIYDGCQLGDRVHLHSGTVVGADGFGYAYHQGVQHKVLQVGDVRIGDDVEVGANSAIDRAMADSTVIGPGTKIDNLVQVGHNVRTGKGCILCGQVALAGSVTLGDFVVMGGGSASVNHLHIGSGAQFGARATAVSDVDPGEVMGGPVPALPLGVWKRITAILPRLPDMVRRLRRVEKRLDHLDGEAADD